MGPVNVIIAAGGKGARFGEGTPKPLVRAPIENGLPLIEYMVRGVARDERIDRIYVCGSTETKTGPMVADHLSTLCMRGRPAVELVSGPRRGAGFAFYLGLKQAARNSENRVLLTVADAVATPGDYRNILQHRAPVVMGMTNVEAVVNKKFTTVYVDGDRVSWEPTSDKSMPYFLRGIYKLGPETLPGLVEHFEDALKHRSEDHSVFYGGNEMGLSWLWRTLIAEGKGDMLRACLLQAVCEVNLQEDLPRFEEFARSYLSELHPPKQ